MDGMIWVINWVPLVWLGLLLVFIAVLISLDFLVVKVIPMRTCPVCKRTWVPLSSDPPTKVCTQCRLGIELNPKKKGK